MSETCSVCGGAAHVEVAVFSSDATVSVETEITDESLWMLHQRYNTDAQDVFEYYFAQALDDVRRAAVWTGYACDECWDTEFTGVFSGECDRCLVDMEEADTSEYRAYNLSMIATVDVDDVASRQSARGLSEAAASHAEATIAGAGDGVLCQSCVKRIEGLSSVGVIGRAKQVLGRR